MCIRDRLYSNLGKPLLTIVADTCGRHDTLGGACAQESNTVRYAPVSYTHLDVYKRQEAHFAPAWEGEHPLADL